MQQYTRRQIRDCILRKLGRVPAVDLGIGPAGTPNPNDSRFSVPLLNDCIDATVSDLNVKCGLGGNSRPLSKAVEAQTSTGPLRIDLTGEFLPREASINTVNRVWWNDGVGNIVLTNTHYRWLDANQDDFYSTPPGVPSLWWIEGYTLWISAAPQLPGTIYILADEALHSPINDDDTIAQLPSDCNWVVITGAALRVAASQPDDRVMQSNMALLKPEYDDGTFQLKSLLGRMNGSYQPGFVTCDYRQNRGTAR